MTNVCERCCNKMICIYFSWILPWKPSRRCRPGPPDSHYQPTHVRIYLQAILYRATTTCPRSTTTLSPKRNRKHESWLPDGKISFRSHGQWTSAKLCRISLRQPTSLFRTYESGN